MDQNGCTTLQRHQHPVQDQALRTRSKSQKEQKHPAGRWWPPWMSMEELRLRSREQSDNMPVPGWQAALHFPVPSREVPLIRTNQQEQQQSFASVDAVTIPEPPIENSTSDTSTLPGTGGPQQSLDQLLEAIHLGDQLEEDLHQHKLWLSLVWLHQR